jgi:hypothetical protein
VQPVAVSRIALHTGALAIPAARAIVIAENASATEHLGVGTRVARVRRLITHCGDSSLEPREGDSGHCDDRYAAPSDDGGPAAAHAFGDEIGPPCVKLPEYFAIAQEALEFGEPVHCTAPCSVAVAPACCVDWQTIEHCRPQDRGDVIQIDATAATRGCGDHQARRGTKRESRNVNSGNCC